MAASSKIWKMCAFNLIHGHSLLFPKPCRRKIADPTLWANKVIVGFSFQLSIPPSHFLLPRKKVWGRSFVNNSYPFSFLPNAAGHSRKKKNSNRRINIFLCRTYSPNYIKTIMRQKRKGNLYCLRLWLIPSTWRITSLPSLFYDQIKCTKRFLYSFKSGLTCRNKP